MSPINTVNHQHIIETRREIDSEVTLKYHVQKKLLLLQCKSKVKHILAGTIKTSYTSVTNSAVHMDQYSRQLHREMPELTHPVIAQLVERRTVECVQISLGRQFDSVSQEIFYPAHICYLRSKYEVYINHCVVTFTHTQICM